MHETLDRWRVRVAVRVMRAFAKRCQRQGIEEKQHMVLIRRSQAYGTFIKSLRVMYFGRVYYKAFYAVRQAYVDGTPTAASYASADGHRRMFMLKRGLGSWRRRVKQCQQQRLGVGLLSGAGDGVGQGSGEGVAHPDPNPNPLYDHFFSAPLLATERHPNPHPNPNPNSIFGRKSQPTPNPTLYPNIYASRAPNPKLARNPILGRCGDRFLLVPRVTLAMADKTADR